MSVRVCFSQGSPSLFPRAAVMPGRCHPWGSTSLPALVISCFLACSYLNRCKTVTSPFKSSGADHLQGPHLPDRSPRAWWSVHCAAVTQAAQEPSGTAAETVSRYHSGLPGTEANSSAGALGPPKVLGWACSVVATLKISHANGLLGSCAGE